MNAAAADHTAGLAMQRFTCPLCSAVTLVPEGSKGVAVSCPVHGGPEDLAFGMVVGIIAGTYSSIYVAAPLTEYIDRRMSKGGAAGVKKRLQAAKAT